MRYSPTINSKERKIPEKIDWDIFGPKLYESLCEALDDHDEAFSGVPFPCVLDCWSHKAKKLVEKIISNP